jgi:hypothetical protein
LEKITSVLIKDEKFKESRGRIVGIVLAFRTTKTKTMYTISRNYSLFAQRNNVYESYTIKVSVYSIGLNKKGEAPVHWVKIDSFLNDKFHGHKLETIFDFPPTLENMSKFFFKRFKKEIPNISAVIVQDCEQSVEYVASHDEDDGELYLKGESHKTLYPKKK